MFIARLRTTNLHLITPIITTHMSIMMFSNFDPTRKTSLTLTDPTTTNNPLQRPPSSLARPSPSSRQTRLTLQCLTWRLVFPTSPSPWALARPSPIITLSSPGRTNSQCCPTPSILTTSPTSSCSQERLPPRPFPSRAPPQRQALHWSLKPLQSPSPLLRHSPSRPWTIYHVNLSQILRKNEQPKIRLLLLLTRLLWYIWPEWILRLFERTPWWGSNMEFKWNLELWLDWLIQLMIILQNIVKKYIPLVRGKWKKKIILLGIRKMRALKENGFFFKRRI